MAVIRFILLVLAALFFLCAAFDWPPGPIKHPMPTGLFCWVLAVLLSDTPPWRRAQ